jgi:hypothetical protein
VLSGAGRDAITACGFVLAALTAAALLVPMRIDRPPDSPPPSPNVPAESAPTPEPAVVIGVSNAAPEYDWGLDRAMRAWNKSGARVRFTYTTADDADVVVMTAPEDACELPQAAACTFAGRPGGGQRPIWIVQRLGRYDMARLLVHELGHILGLGHVNEGCVAMTPGPWQNCRPAPRGTWRCRLLALGDIERAVRIYGGTARPLAGPVFCRTKQGT